MIRFLLQLVILDYSFLAAEKDFSNKFTWASSKYNLVKDNITDRHLKVDMIDDRIQNLLGICGLITENTPEFLKKLEKCKKKNVSKTSQNKTFSLNVCDVILKENDSGTNDTLGTLTFDETIPEILNRSGNVPDYTDTSKDALVDAPVLSKPSAKLFSLESNLELKMDEEWDENEPKASYKSHIYTGTSRFPLTFQISRIIGPHRAVLKGASPQPEIDQLTSEIPKTVTKK